MNRLGVLAVFLPVIAIFAYSSTTHAETVQRGTEQNDVQQSEVRDGTNLLMICCCNDCHTPGWPESNGTVPEKDWLTGVPVGWRGPWGTTYASNLRIFINRFTEDEWINYAHTVELRPPMPWWALHAMTDDELRTIYRKVKELGPAGVKQPDYVDSTHNPVTPYILFMPQNPPGCKK